MNSLRQKFLRFKEKRAQEANATFDASPYSRATPKQALTTEQANQRREKNARLALIRSRVYKGQ